MERSDGKRVRSRSPPYSEKRSRVSPRPPTHPREFRPSEGTRQNGVNPPDDRTARLAAMSSNANTLTTERQERLKIMLEKEKAELEAEDRARARSKGFGSFIGAEQKKVFGGIGGLEERIRGGKAGLVRNID
jgi:hypothetical protein